jgi:F-type H+-transporting ATPase subunit b
MENLAKLGLNLSWLIAQVINFILILLILRAFAYKPILKLLADRKQKIQDSLEYAEKVKADAAAQQAEFEKRIEAARREASQATQSATQVAEKEKERILAEARDEARQIVEQARGQLDYERKQMMSELREQVVNLSLLAAQRVIGQSLDERRSRQLVDEFLKETDFGGDGQKVPA